MKAYIVAVVGYKILLVACMVPRTFKASGDVLLAAIDSALEGVIPEPAGQVIAMSIARVPED